MVGQTQDGDFCPPCQARKARGLCCTAAMSWPWPPPPAMAWTAR